MCVCVYVLPILIRGLRRPGDCGVRVQHGHAYSTSHKTIYLSPSIEYAAFPVYSPFVQAGQEHWVHQNSLTLRNYMVQRDAAIRVPCRVYNPDDRRPSPVFGQTFQCRETQRDAAIRERQSWGQSRPMRRIESIDLSPVGLGGSPCRVAQWKVEKEMEKEAKASKQARQSKQSKQASKQFFVKETSSRGSSQRIRGGVFRSR
jgi:hypothetical protein